MTRNNPERERKANVLDAGLLGSSPGPEGEHDLGMGRRVQHSWMLFFTDFPLSVPQFPYLLNRSIATALP